MDQPKLLLESVSPNGNVNAFVEQTGNAIHFYLYFPNASEQSDRVRMCWVRNTGPAPEDIDPPSEGEDMRAPMLPARYCRCPEGSPELNPDDLSIVWFEEGNGAALLEGGETLAIIPSWSGVNDFNGYARDCTAESLLCWPLAPDNVLHERVARAAEYWSAWDDETYWPNFQMRMLEAYEHAFGVKESMYFAIDDGAWPPRALVRYDLPDRCVLVTVGMSLRPQPNVELFMDDPEVARRIEIGAAFEPGCPEDEIQQFGQFMSGMAAYPWDFYHWFGSGHTTDCEAVPVSLGGSRFPAVLFTSEAYDKPMVDFDTFRGDPINLLWLVPITASELEIVHNDGSEVFVQRLENAGAGSVHRLRDEIAER
jgi:hypothetical protein